MIHLAAKVGGLFANLSQKVSVYIFFVCLQQDGVSSRERESADK